MTNTALKEATTRISCNPKQMKEQLFQFGAETNNLKATIGLANKMIDKCGLGGKKSKSNGPKRAPSAYNNFIKACFERHKGDADYGFKPTGTKCRLEWRKQNGK